MTQQRSEIAFFDLETTVPTRPGQGFSILEFGAILVCSRKLVELRVYSTLVCPSDLSLISARTARRNGITRDSVGSAPSFADIADQVFDLLHGRIWAGHNIVKFDSARIREEFNKISRPAPQPKGIIDSLTLLTQRFGRRAGDMKMDTLASYFEIGKQKHRSLDDVRMNIEVLKYCATVLFLESSLPYLLTANKLDCPRPATRSNTKSKSSPEGFSPTTKSPPSLTNENLFPSTSQETVEQNPILSLVTHSAVEVSNLVAADTGHRDPFDMSALFNELETEALQSNANIEENHEPGSNGTPSTAASSEGSSSNTGFLDPVEVTLTSIRACVIPWYHGSQKIGLLHNDDVLQLFCSGLRVRYGVSTKFVDHYGRPRLSFVVDASPSLCGVLNQCDDIAKQNYGSTSEWRPVVNNNEHLNYPTVPTTRLNIPIAKNGGLDEIETEIHQRDNSGTTNKLVFKKFETAELIKLIWPGSFVDVFLTFDSYDIQQRAGIRLVAKKLVIH